jgi:hypothetical protein
MGPLPSASAVLSRPFQRSMIRSTSVGAGAGGDAVSPFARIV